MPKEPSIALLVVPTRRGAVFLVVLLRLTLLRPGLRLRLRIAAGHLVALLHLLPLLHGIALLHLLLHRLALLGFLLLHLLPLLDHVALLQLLSLQCLALLDFLLLHLLALLQLLLLRGPSLLHLLLHVLALLHGVVALEPLVVVLVRLAHRLLRRGLFEAWRVRQRAGPCLAAHAVRFGIGDVAHAGARLVVLATRIGGLAVRASEARGR